MPANSRVFLKPFIGGLNTEGSDTDDMVLNTSDELNCTILPEQMRGRRYGFNIEKDGKWIDTDVTENVTGSVYYWKNVAKTDLDILVCRIGSKLYFFDAAIKPITDSEPLGLVDLKDYIIDDNNFYKEKFGFTTGDGKLTVVNRWMQPIRVIYNVVTSSFVVEAFTLSIRDVEGVDDGWEIKNVQELVEEGQAETTRSKEGPFWIILDPDYKAAYIPYINSLGVPYLRARNSRLNTNNNLLQCTTETVGNETHVFYNDKDIGIFQAQNSSMYIPGGSREHLYNLLNQGWNRQDLENFKQDVEIVGVHSWPDNTMAVSIGRDNTGHYNTGEVAFTYLGNTRQPRGHFILDYFRMNRSQASNIYDDYSGSVATYSYQNTWIKNRHLRGVPIYKHSSTVKNSEGYFTGVEIVWTKLYRKSGKKSSDLHWIGRITVNVYGLKNGNWERVLVRNTNSSDGASSSDPMSFVAYETPTQDSVYYDQYKVDITYDRGNASDSADGRPYGVTCSIRIYSVQDIEDVTGRGTDYFSNPSDASKVTDVAYMSGKYFYLCKDSVLFSQTVKEDGTGFDLCYQNADPTSTEVSDVVTTDGGYVKFNTMGRGMALKTFNRGVLVFGRDVVYGLISPIEGKFTATDYDILELSRAGLIGSESVVSTTQQVYYWSPTGIYTIGVNPETGSTIFAQSVSLNTIQTYYNNLAQFSKEHCKGVYDYTSNRIYWYFPTNVDQLNNLDGCLVYDLTYNCFMPQNVAESEGKSTLDVTEVSQSYEIEPTVYLRAGGNRVIAGEDKVLAVDETSTDYHRWTSIQHLITMHDLSGYKFSIGDFNDREFKDWEHHDYSSYLVSRPITLGDTYFNKQTPVMQTLFKRTEEYKLKERSDKYVTTYSLEPYRMQVSNGKIRSYTDVLNAGKFIKTYVTLDFTGFTDTISEIDIKIIGKKNGSAYIGTQTLHDITSTTKYTTAVECSPEYADQEFDKFSIQIKVTPNSSEDLHDIDETNTFILNRTRIDEKKFKGYKEVSVTGRTSLENIQDNDYKVSFKTVEGKLKDATITFSPLILSLYSPSSWDADLLALLAGPVEVSTGINTSVEGQTGNYVLSGSPDSGVLLFDQFSIVMNNIQVHGGALSFVTVSYNLTLLAPEYEDFAIIESADYTTPSGAIIRMRWGWSVNPLSNRWDMMQNGYRPQKDFLHDDYVESRLHIRGRGKAFQVEIRNDDNKDFRLTGLNIITRSPQ